MGDRYKYGHPRWYNTGYNRKRKRELSEQLKFRTGQKSASGGVPFNQRTKIIDTTCAGQLGNSITTAGDTCAFLCTNWSNPCDPFANTTFDVRGTVGNHPSGHLEAVAGGYDLSRVISAMYKFDIRWTGTDNAAKDFIFAYKFGIGSAAAIVLTAGDPAGVDNWKDMRQSRGWAYTQFSATNRGGSVYPSQATVRVKIPDMWRLTEKLFMNDASQVNIEETRGVIDDSGANNPVIGPFLHIVVMTIDGTALEVSPPDIIIDLTCYQRVHLSRNISTVEMIDEADQV